MSKDIFKMTEEMFAYVQSFEESDPRRILGEKVYETISTGEFTNRSYAKQYIRFRRYSTKTISEKLNTTTENIRRMRTNLKKDAFALLGENIFDIIYDNDLKMISATLKNFDAIVEFRKSSELFPNEIIDSIKSVTTEGKTYKVENCYPELGFLYWLMSDRLKDIALDLDLDRLKFLISTIDGKRLGADRIKILRILLKDNILNTRLSEEARKSFTFPPKREEQEESEESE